MRETYGVVLQGMNLAELSGKLIVIEGTDGVGRSTQINLLSPGSNIRAMPWLTPE